MKTIKPICSCEYGGRPSNLCVRCGSCHTRLCQIHAGENRVHDEGDPQIHNLRHDCERLVNNKKPLMEYQKEWLKPKV